MACSTMDIVEIFAMVVYVCVVRGGISVTSGSMICIVA